MNAGNKVRIGRRRLLRLGVGALGLSAATIDALETLVGVPQRIAQAHQYETAKLPDIQYDIEDFLAPIQTIKGILFRFGPVYTLFLTAKLAQTPTSNDQKHLEDALSTIESTYAFSPSGIFTFVGYGLPYFERFDPDMVNDYMPRLLSHPERFALEESVPGPTDVSPRNASIRKRKYHVAVTIEGNDMLFTLRSDSLANINDVANWLQGSNMLKGSKIQSPALSKQATFTSSRLMFAQLGLPRKLAIARRLPYAKRIHPQSPMWMGFADQQIDAAGPASITTFQGNDSASFTDVIEGDYFYNGSIQHLSHVILDLEQFYADDEPYTERCQYMFRSNPPPAYGGKDQFTDGGGEAFIANEFKGTDDALSNARAIGTDDEEPRMGHTCALQRSSRADDGTPVHIRMDGSGFDAMDVPDGSQQPKLQFTIFVPTADFFATLRKNQASLDLVKTNRVKNEDNGLERFLTATRRQNFLVPPRMHRAFPLAEFAE